MNKYNYKWTNTIINEQTNTIINEQTNTIINEQTNTVINEQTNTIINGQTNTIINEQTNTIINEQTNNDVMCLWVRRLLFVDTFVGRNLVPAHTLLYLAPVSGAKNPQTASSFLVRVGGQITVPTNAWQMANLPLKKKNSPSKLSFSYLCVSVGKELDSLFIVHFIY